MDDRNPKGLKNLLQNTGDKNSSALAVVPKKPDDLVEEQIDSQILSILGLEDVFDLTYEEYASLLKEASVRGRMPNSQMTTESTELVTNELKRVRNKTGRFKVVPKKVNIDKVLNRQAPAPPGAIVKADKLIPTTTDEEEKSIVESKASQTEIQTGLANILTSLVTVKSILQNQNKVEQQTAVAERKQQEKKKKKDREDALEKRKGVDFKLPNAISKPLDNFFETIKTFFKNILLGSVVLGLYKWLKNPVNEKAINDFGNFLTNNAPLILGGLLAIAALPIATTLFNLTLGIVTGIGMLGTALGGLTTLLPAFGLFGAYVGGKMIFKNIQKYVSGEDAPAVQSELQRLRKDLSTRQTQALLMSGEEKIAAQKKNKEDEKKLDRIEQELIPRMTKTQSMKRQLRLTKEKLKKDEEEFKKLKGYEKTPFYKTKVKDIETSKKIIEAAEKNIPVSQREQDKLMKDIFGASGAQGDIFDRINKFIKDSEKMVENLNKSSYKSPFAGARDKEALKASKITGNAPITVGERAGYSASRKRPHRGRDIAAPSGTGLQVSSDSVITDKGFEDGYGNFVVFKDSNGIEHLYGHMLEASPYNKGDQVPAGTVIGRVGSTGRSTGPHLHWEVSRVMGEVGRPRENIIDPIEIGFPAQAPFTGKVEAAQLAKSKAPTPSIPSPTGRSNIIPLPIPMGGQQASQSNSAPLQTPVPSFSSEDPNNMTTLVVRAIYNVVG